VKSLLKIFFILFLGVMVLHAQENKEITDKAQKVSVRLQQKLLLTDVQTAKIKSLIIDNFSQIKENKTSIIETKVISILNDKQKEKFTIIKKDWLQSLQSR
jgi:1,2-phenylacetyl-CoA epoxidase PaaB subunit